MFAVQSVSSLNRRDWIGYTVLVVAWVAANANFWVWWLQPEHIDAAWMFWPLTASLAYSGTFLTSVYLYFVGHMRRPVPVPVVPGMKIALITLCVPGQEGLDVIEKQLEALSRVSYVHDSWVLDEGNDVRVQALAKRWNVGYFSRAGIERLNQPGPPFKIKTKAGNVNAWLDAHGTAYEVFVQFDIDHAPCPDYLEHVLGYFRDPCVGWVQAPSVYGNLSNWVARGSAEQELVLQGPLQQGFYGLSQTPFIIGSHTSYRTAAILEIGGFQPTRAEDHLDSLLLATRGYRGVFVPQVIATGAGPETFDTYLQQQFAWAMSLVQVLFGYAPRLVGQLGLKRALQFLFAESWYPLSSLTLLIMSLTPIVALISHQQPANVGLLPFLLRWVPIGIVSTTIWIWTRRWHMPPGLQLSWRGVVLYVARWPIVLWAVINAVLGVRRPYMITRKGSASSDRRVAIVGHNTSRRVRQDRRAAPRAGVGPVTSLRSRLVYLLVAWSMGAVVFWSINLHGLGAAAETDLDRARVQGFALVVIWGASFFLLVYAVNVIGGVAELWRNSRRLARVTREYGLAIPVLVVSVALWLVLLSQSVREGQIANPQVWPGQTQVPVLASAKPAPVTDLSADGITVGAYDPSGAPGGLKLPLEHWFVVQSDRAAFVQALATSSTNGAIPLITLEPFPASDDTTSVLYNTTLGVTDEQLAAAAQSVVDGKPQVVLIRWAHEMDLSGLYPWSEDDPVLYQAAYRHVVQVFREAGATNVRWVWSPSGNAGSNAYYPGDDVVDFVGMTVLGDAEWDKLLLNESSTSFAQLLSAKYPGLAIYTKPMIIAELGVSGTPEHQQQWLEDAVHSLPDFPLIRAIAYFDAVNAVNNHLPTEPDWRVSPDVLLRFALDVGTLPLHSGEGGGPGGEAVVGGPGEPGL